MNIIVIGRRGQRPYRLDITLKQAGWAAMMAMGSLFLGAISLGYWLGESQGNSETDTLATIASLKESIDRQKAQLVEKEAQHQQALDALARELGRLQARSVRMDELALRLADAADFDLTDLNRELAGTPGTGSGPLEAAKPLAVDEFRQYVAELGQRLQRQEEQLSILGTRMQAELRDAQFVPHGRPVQSGWLSSLYGKRVDPISGKTARHGGLDFSGHMGTSVQAVADGVVIWSGPRYGYGNLVEIDHGNGYVTRYAHNRKNLVKVGERVRRGQPIAEMGKSGRATGPHVHFEILFNNRRLNPRPFLG